MEAASVRPSSSRGLLELTMQLNHAGVAVANAVGQIIDEERPNDNPNRSIASDRHIQKELHYADAKHNSWKHKRHGAELIDDLGTRRLPYRQPGAHRGQKHHHARADERYRHRIHRQANVTVRRKYITIIIKRYECES
jgi:hypothetical protein